MKKLLAMLVAVAIVAGGCCNRHRLDSVSWSEDTPSRYGLQSVDLDDLQIAVTVRTEPGQSFRLFGVPIDTRGEQWWILGSRYESEPTHPVPGLPSRPFWVSRPEGSIQQPPANRDELESAYQRMLEPTLEAQAPAQPLIYFGINDKVVAVRLFTPHEGILERIHIDAPEGRSGDDVTVIGYYSGSAGETALRYPMKKCVWCGGIQVCSADPSCPN